MTRHPLIYTPKSLDVIVLRGQWYNPFVPVVGFKTQSRWTHCVQVRGADGRIFDAHTKGVECRKINDYAGRHAAVLRRRDIDQIPAKDKIEMIKWADGLVSANNKYDFMALIGFVLGITLFEDDERWYCAELPYWMWQYHGYPMFNQELTFVYPSDHYRSRVYYIVAEGVIEREKNYGVGVGVTDGGDNGICGDENLKLRLGAAGFSNGLRGLETIPV